MELTPEEIAKKALNTLELVKDEDVKYFSSEYFYKELSRLIREYGEQQRQKEREEKI